MVNVILEIALKEISSYYRNKSAILRNILMLLIFCFIPAQQIHAYISANGYTASSLSYSLETYLIFATFYAMMVSTSIAILAFPWEKEHKTIEYLLSLPLTDSEILAGKALSAILSGLFGLVLLFSMIPGFILCIDGSHIVWDSGLLTPSLAMVIFAIAPGIVILSTFLLVVISSFLNIREAYAASFIIMGLFVGFAFIKALLPVNAIIFNAVLLEIIVIAILVTYTIAVKTFNREAILSKV